MRFSEGVKRYDEETKKRIFDEIIAAAEKDNAAVNSHKDNETAVIAQQNLEDNTMKNTEERARIRSSRGGVIAAACAVLVVGGGIFAAGHMNGGSKGVTPGASGTSYTTTDAEDISSEESTAEKDETLTNDETSSPKVADVDGKTWRKETNEETIRLVDSSDFIGLVQVVNIQRETIDGEEYTDYFCSLIDEDGHAGIVFKYTGDEIPTRLSIMEQSQVEENVKKGDKLLVFAKNGVQSASGGYSLELTEDLTMFRWGDEVDRYVNVYRPGHIITDTSEGIYGDYLCGLYEMGLDNYYKDILYAMCDDYNYDAFKNWCEFEGLSFNVEVESGQDFPEGAITSISYPNNPDNIGAIVVSISDGLSYTGKNDSDEETQAAIDLNVRDKGTTIKEFADYDLELGGLFYEEDDNTYGVVIDVSKKDGSAFSHEDWVENHMDLVYGDVEPIMKLTNSSYLESGLSWLTEDDSKMRVACIFHADTPLFEVDSSVPVTLQVNTVRWESGVEEEGLFEVTFNIDITDIK